MERFRAGSIILLNNANGNLLSKLVRFFTNSTISHTDFTLGSLVREESVLSAEELISVLPLVTYFPDEAYEFKVYEIVGIPEAKLEEWTTGAYLEYSGKTYGYLQLLWFIYRWAMEKLGRDVRRGKNWFPKNAVCSELVYNLLRRVGSVFVDNSLKWKLDEWNPNGNTVTPEDIKRIVEEFPTIFKLKTVCSRGMITYDTRRP